MTDEKKFKVQVTISNGTVFELPPFHTEAFAIETANFIIKDGYRFTAENSNDLHIFPSHSILKVVVLNGSTTHKHHANIIDLNYSR
jgi:hypothetical protein